jgi:plastocyanin
MAAPTPRRREVLQVLKRWLVAVSVGLLLTTAFGACGGGDDDDGGGGGDTSAGTTAEDDGAGGGPVVTIKDFSFGGATSIKVNTSVTVKNEGGTRHTFTPDHAGDFQGATLAAGASTSIDFAKAGTFPYHCEIHSSMKGTIEVTE